MFRILKPLSKYNKRQINQSSIYPASTATKASLLFYIEVISFN